MSNTYGHNFYKDRHRNTVFSANAILPIVMDVIPKVRSAVDFGCGVGTWLSVLKEKGVAEIQGIDGDWVDKDLLEIPEQKFRQADLDAVIKLYRRYDLAISLEVAEHLQPESANHFVDNLTNASDFVLFSAALPFQGGAGHINEQWPDYWVDLFRNRGYVVLDIVRSRIWNEQAIPFWYRQNTLLFVKREQMQKLETLDSVAHYQRPPVSIVHPDLYLLKISKINRADTVKGNLKLFRRAVKKWIKTRIRRRGVSAR